MSGSVARMIYFRKNSIVAYEIEIDKNHDV